jgi:type II secretion system protein J
LHSAFRIPHSALRRGLTLVELMMAGTIFAVLMTGMVLHVRGGAVAWRRVTRTVEDLQQVRVVLERLTQDLVNAVVIDPRPEATPSVHMTREALEFYTLRMDRGRSEGNATVQFVTYALRPDAEGSTLVRTAQTIPEAKAAPPDRAQELLTGVERVAIRYGSVAPTEPSSVEWRDEWADANTFPKLVEIVLDRRGASSILESIRQVIQIPSGSLRYAE